MSAVVTEDKASVVLVSRKFRRKLTVRRKADDEISAYVQPLLNAHVLPLLAYTFAPLANVRLSVEYSSINPSLWVGNTAFELEVGEVAKVAEALGLEVKK